LRIEAGADTGKRWKILQFDTIDHAGHARCAVHLASKTHTKEPRPAETSRFGIEFPPELRLVERLARECIALNDDFRRDAGPIGLPAGFPGGASPDSFELPDKNDRIRAAISLSFRAIRDSITLRVQAQEI
jgi:hypothetical protein